MKCPKCQHENTATAKFCEECAEPLAARACASCGSAVSSTAKFCPQCGHPLTPVAENPRFASPHSYTPRYIADKILTAQAAPMGERKQVTVLFADIKGSMELLADHDPEDAQKLLDPVLECMIEAVHRYEGSSARRSPTRTMPRAPVMRRSECKRPSHDMQTSFNGLTGCRLQSELDSTQGRSLSVPSATTCT